MQAFQTAASVRMHRLPHSAKPHSRISPQRGIKIKQTDGQYSLDPDTMTLVLNEAEQLTENGPASEPEAEKVIVRPSTHRSKGKMEKDLASVPEVDQECTLSEEVLTALFPDGYTGLPAEKMRPLLEYTPAHLQQVISYVHVYKGKDGTIVKAEHPQRLFKGSIATPSLISAVMNSKYINAVPLNRCAQEFAGNGAVLSREALAAWMICVSERYFSLLYDRMHQKLLESRLVHCDETPFVVVQNGKSSGAKDYMWVYHTGPEHGSPPVYLYQYSPTRKTENPRNFLKGYQGVLVTDGYQVYHTLEKESGGDLKVAGCWAHANGLRPYYYFKHVLETMIPHMDDKNTDFLEELLPWSKNLPEVCRAKEK